MIVAKWVCACGATIQSSGAMPNPSEWLLISDVAFDQFEGQVDSEAVYRAASHAFRCAECGRLHVFWDGLSADPAVYSID